MANYPTTNIINKIKIMDKEEIDNRKKWLEFRTEIFKQFENIIEVIEKGSVITKDNGIKTLAKVASTKAEYNALVFPYLIEQLKSCRLKSVPQYGESMMIAVTSGNEDQYLGVLKKRFDDLSTTQQRRLNKLFRAFEKR